MAEKKPRKVQGRASQPFAGVSAPDFQARFAANFETMMPGYLERPSVGRGRGQRSTQPVLPGRMTSKNANTPERTESKKRLEQKAASETKRSADSARSAASTGRKAANDTRGPGWAERRMKAIERETLRKAGYVKGVTREPTAWERDNLQFFDPNGTPIYNEGGENFNYNVVGGGKETGNNQFLGQDVRGYRYQSEWSQDPTFDAPDLNVRYDDKGNPEPPMPGDYTTPTPYKINPPRKK